MKITIQKDRLTLEDEEKEHPVKCETLLGEKDQKRINENPDNLREFQIGKANTCSCICEGTHIPAIVRVFLEEEREWRVTYPESEAKSYVRLGKLGEGENLPFESIRRTTKKKEAKKSDDL